MSRGIPRSSGAPRAAGIRLFGLVIAWLGVFGPGMGSAIDAAAPVPVEETPEEVIAEADTTSGLDLVSDLTPIIVLPFLVHSEHPLQYLSESLPTLLAAQLEGTRKLVVVDAKRVAKARPELETGVLPDSELRKLCRELGAVAVVAGSVTELAGRYSLDVRITPADAGTRSHTLVYTAEGEEALVNLLSELTEQVLAVVSGADPGRIIGLTVVGAGPLEPEVRSLIVSQAGTPYDVKQVRADRDRIQAMEGVARVNVDTTRKAGGVVLTFSVVRAEMIMGQAAGNREGDVVDSIAVRGNRRIETDAILGRIRTEVGKPLNRATLAADVREINSLGFFRNVYVFAEQKDGGLRLTFEVEENPVIRQISILGNDSVDSDDIRDVLTLTTGSTLDYPLLHENTERITQLYRQQGYYLAEVTYSIGEETEGAISVDFEVQENGKLKLKDIEFYGNEAFSSRQLKEDFQTKTWRFYSFATSWLDHTGTYSEPIFARDLREVEKKYTDDGYLQVEIGQPEVDATEEGLFVRVKVTEGPQFDVGEIDVYGDETVDLDVLRELLQLDEGEVFNRSHLTEDVEALERHYTDRGFFLATVQPTTRLSQEDRTVDVNFVVEKGPLYFVRNINIAGNTRTIDPVVRREMKIVEGQLYSARGIQISTRRIQGLGFFEDISFEPQPTEDPSQLDLNVNVVERPTGSFSFGAGYSSQDKLVFTASLAQSNWLGRGYYVNLTVDIGGTTNRYFISLSDPYFLGSTFSLAGTVFVTKIAFDTYEQNQKGFNLTLGHALSENNDTRGALTYRWSSREVNQPTSTYAASPILRELLQGSESSSILGVSVTRDTRNDRFSATSGTYAGGVLEYSGLGGFAKFLRAEGRFAWYLGAPKWLIDRSSFVVSTRLGYALPFNSLSDWDLLVRGPSFCDDPSKCVGMGQLDQIDTDLTLPLTERYFLGGIGSFQLRGYRARSVGPRRSILQRAFGGATSDFLPVGTQPEYDQAQDRWVATCRDTGILTTGDGDGRCNSIDDKHIDDFADLDETDVVGGNSFISSSFEYRFPISEEVGLQGVFFVDGGNAFYEGQNLFDATEWRYGYGGGVLWFSPFGPLQLVLGFPIDPYSFEDSPVFEFSVGGFGL